MLYVSFAEILPVAVTHFAAAGVDAPTDVTFGTVAFFGGIAFAVGLDVFTDWLWPLPKHLSAENISNAALVC